MSTPTKLTETHETHVTEVGDEIKVIRAPRIWRRSRTTIESRSKKKLVKKRCIKA